VTDDSAFKKQVRARMADTGEKYTEARRAVIMMAAIRAAVRRSIERGSEQAVGLSDVEADTAGDRLHVTIRAARPELAWGFLGPRETEGIWRELAADHLRAELEELTGRRVRLVIYRVPSAAP
jgi:ribosomal protein S3